MVLARQELLLWMLVLAVLAFLGCLSSYLICHDIRWVDRADGVDRGTADEFAGRTGLSKANLNLPSISCVMLSSSPVARPCTLSSSPSLPNRTPGNSLCADVACRESAATFTWAVGPMQSVGGFGPDFKYCPSP